MNVGEIFVALGFDVDDSKLKSFDKGIQSLTLNVTAAFGTLTAGMYAIDRYVDSTTRGAVSLTNFNQQTDLSIDKLQRWQNAAELLNPDMTADRVTSSIANLQDQLVQIGMMQGNSSPFALMGIDVFNQDAFQILDQIRDRMKDGANRAVLTNLFKQMGVDPGMIQALSATREEFDRLGDKFIQTPQMTTNLNDLAKSLTLVEKSLSFFSQQFLSDHKAEFEQGIQLVFQFGEAVLNAGHALAHIYEKAGEFQGGILALGGVMLWRLFPVLTTLLLIVAALDDIDGYLNNKDSLTGRFINYISDSWLDLKQSSNQSNPGRIPWLLNMNARHQDYLRTVTNDPDADFTPFDNPNYGGDTLNESLYKRGGSGNLTGGDNTVNFNNTYNIQGDDDQSLAETIVDEQKEQFDNNATFDEVNRGNEN